MLRRKPQVSRLFVLEIVTYFNAYEVSFILLSWRYYQLPPGGCRLSPASKIQAGGVRTARIGSYFERMSATVADALIVDIML